MDTSGFLNQWFDCREYVDAHTSGSTGAPKDVRLLKADMVASARMTVEYFGLGDRSVLLCPLSADYIAGKMMLVRALYAHAVVVMLTPANCPVFSAADLLAIVPSQVDELVRHKELASCISNIIIGGAELSERRRRALIDAGFNAYETYGMTETCSHVALRRVCDGEQGRAFEALPGVHFSVDERGCLIVDVPHLSVGRVVTNDVVQLIDDGHFIWKGRFDNVINSGGIKIHPEQLEAEIARIIGPRVKFYVCGVDDDRWGRAVAMVYEGSAEDSPHIAEMLSAALDHRCLPKHYYAVKALARTSSGKIRRLPPDR